MPMQPNPAVSAPDVVVVAARPPAGGFFVAAAEHGRAAWRFWTVPDHQAHPIGGGFPRGENHLRPLGLGGGAARLRPLGPWAVLGLGPWGWAERMAARNPGLAVGDANSATAELVPGAMFSRQLG